MSGIKFKHFIWTHNDNDMHCNTHSKINVIWPDASLMLLCGRYGQPGMIAAGTNTTQDIHESRFTQTSKI